ncbi:unnamed protein product [Periconia digitata]|uniref:Ig-like domain-containing protein n=1 Tax=Periconia digitata TaxID=1303443 RepID=A0A9W4UUA2_9PLEO|nr:unnamed protein product [Periconia digitata]
MASTAALLLSSAALAHGYTFTTSSVPKVGYTTVKPGGTYAPVTVTSQYQPIPTYISSASSYDTYLYVSTVIADANSKNITVTNTDQPITFHHERYTITHTGPEDSSASTGLPHPSGSGHYPYLPNATVVHQPHTWTELYEKIDQAPYRDLGPSALPAYSGSGLCSKCRGEGSIIYQPARVSEYSNNQWTKYNTTYTYGLPVPSVTTYKQPGTYTIPKYDVTVEQPSTVPAEASYTALPSKTVTYGGSLTEVTEPCTITAHYGAYSVATSSGKPTTKTIIRTTTIVAGKPGTYTIATPTTTWYSTKEICTYPTISVYRPGVYEHTRETVTITKTSEAYTCRYHSSSMYPPSSSYATLSKPIQSTNSMASSVEATSTPSHATNEPTIPSSEAQYTSPSSSSSFTSSPPPSYIQTMPPHTNSTSSTPCPSSTSKTSHLSSGSPSKPSSTPSSSTTTPDNPDPSSDHYEEPMESYGTASSGGYVRRGGVLERRNVGGNKNAKAGAGVGAAGRKRVIFV